MRVLKNSLGISHDIVKQVIGKGDIVIDATAGNGNDTLFLAEIVGVEGHVYSFDVQRKALQNTYAKLRDKNLLDCVTLIQDGHEKMDQYVNCNIKAVMFNLGYLPGGDHSIHTKAHTTIEAIQKSLNLIVRNGIVMLVIYYGGDSGFDEKEAVMDLLKEIDSKTYTVLVHDFVNQINCPPIAVCIEKIK